MAALGRTYWLEDHRELYFGIDSGPFAGYRGTSGVPALTFRLQASLAASYLMAGRYDDVILLTDAALDTSEDYREVTYYHHDRELKRKWREDQRVDYQKVHQCRALAHKHMGESLQAVQSMEKALSFDPGDGDVFAQLMQLKKQLEKDVAQHGFHAIFTPSDKDVLS